MSDQLTLFGSCSKGSLDKVPHGWRASCSCGWCGWTVALKEFARDELHGHLRESLLKSQEKGADT
jgi:hypothetical protein